MVSPHKSPTCNRDCCRWATDFLLPLGYEAAQAGGAVTQAKRLERLDFGNEFPYGRGGPSFAFPVMG